MDIKKIIAFVAVGADGEEGIIGMKLNGVWFPFIGGNVEKMKDCYPMAVEICAQEGKEFKVLEFDLVADITEEVKNNPKYNP